MKYLTLIIMLIIALSCSTTKHRSVVVTPEVQEENLDTLNIVAEEAGGDLERKIDEAALLEKMELSNDLPVYRATTRRTIDLIHTKLDIRFDIPNEKVMGIADLTIKPLSRAIREVVLDAKNFEINSIKNDRNHDLAYEYDKERITIDLGRELALGEKTQVTIDYVTHPGTGEIGGSVAITSDQGLYFIDPRDEDPDKPTQIWTQGETESNSRWFPTVDKPNERCTQEIYVTVDQKFETLSNGSLVSGINNADGTRTDYWKMDIPHAPYLFMLAIGEFAVSRESWRGKELSYYVEPDYAESAKQIFNHTPEILTFYSDLFDVEYPWPKLGQVVVRDYVSGAMENTTGIIYGEFIQNHKRNLIDNHNDRILAHEIIHHWFGDMVTCESWSNVTMNEGFANYGEYLWFEHKYGSDAANFHRMNEQTGYLNSALQAGIRDLVDYEYHSREDMFDAHSYNKGGLVLHQLRKYLGDDVFFKGLHTYLVDNAYTAIEAHDLRLAMEKVSGEDLNWFWNQWFFGAGHPTVIVTKDYSESGKTLSINIAQVQEAFDGQPGIFQLPIDIDIYQEGEEVRRERIMVIQRNQTFVFDEDNPPELVVVDAGHSHIGHMTFEKTDDEYVYQYTHAPAFNDRHEAIQKLSLSSHTSKALIMEKAIDDPYWFIRRMALDQISVIDNPGLLDAVRAMALNDKRSEVRAKALNIIGSQNQIQDIELYEKVINNEMAYPVIGAALDNMNSTNPEKALEYAHSLEAQNDKGLVGPIAQVYSSIGSVEYLPFFQQNAKRVSGYESFDFMNLFASYASKLPGESLLNQVNFVTDMAFDSDGDMWKKLALFKTLFDIKELITVDGSQASTLKVIDANISKISESETNPMLMNYYKQFQQ